MGHQVSALIGENKVDKAKILQYGLAVAFEYGFVIVIIDFNAMLELGEFLDKSTDSDSGNLDWDCELTKYVAKEIGLKKFALIQTDYFGGTGSQFATYYENGRRILSEVRINEALKKLGVKKKENLDEFDSLNLGEYRDSEYYYWESENWADRKENMIAGRIIENTP